MARHYFAKFLLFIIIIGFLLYQFAPETFNDIKNSITGSIQSKLNNEENLNANSNANQVIINNLTYLDLGKIAVTRECINDQDCNNNLPSCNGQCICLQDTCKKLR